MQDYNKVVLALGSNLGNKKEYLTQAINAIHSHIGFVAEISAVYKTPSWGFESFPFYNMCIFIHTHFTAEELLKKIKELEQKLGRTAKTNEDYAARTVDIDIIYFNDSIMITDDLVIPHPQMHHRKFVLVPLTELSVEWKHPLIHKTTEEMLEVCNDDSEITKVDSVILYNNYSTFRKLSFLAIEGNIGSGKTSLAQKIAQDFNAKTILERFSGNPFLPKFYENQSRYAFPLEMSFLSDRHKQLTESLQQYNLFNDFIVSDYYIYKSLIFAQVTLNTDETSLYQTFFDVMHKEISVPDLYIYLYQNTGNLLRNIKKRGRTYEKNISERYLDRINHSYSEFIKTLPTENVLVIDITNKNFIDNQEDYIEILTKIDQKIRQLL